MKQLQKYWDIKGQVPLSNCIQIIIDQGHLVSVVPVEYYNNPGTRAAQLTKAIIIVTMQ